MMIAERPAPGQLPAGLFEIAEKRCGRAIPANANAGRSGAGPASRRENVKAGPTARRSTGQALSRRPPAAHQQPRLHRAAREAVRTEVCASRRTGRATPAGRCRASNRNVESHRPARARCRRACSPRLAPPCTGSTTPAPQRAVQRAPASAARRRSARRRCTPGCRR